jgi:hypothetical protein
MSYFKNFVHKILPNGNSTKSQHCPRKLEIKETKSSDSEKSGNLYLTKKMKKKSSKESSMKE